MRAFYWFVLLCLFLLASCSKTKSSDQPQVQNANDDGRPYQSSIKDISCTNNSGDYKIKASINGKNICLDSDFKQKGFNNNWIRQSWGAELIWMLKKDPDSSKWNFHLWMHQVILQNGQARELSSPNPQKIIATLKNNVCFILIRSMVRYSFLFFVIAIIPLLKLVPASIAGEMGYSVIPGWHTAIYPTGSFMSLCQIGWLIVLPLIYFLLEKRQAIISRKLLVFHLICTLTYFINPDPGTMVFDQRYHNWLTFGPIIVFAAGQLIFLLLALKTFASGKPE